MQYFFDGDSNLYGYGAEERAEGFTLPSKIRQMGAIEDGLKIYMEDYVYTYLYQYGKSAGGTEKLAALVGQHLIIDDQETLVICGAIQGKYAREEGGSLQFGDETWEYIGSQMEKYFKGMTLVGWVHCQPGFGSFLMAKDEEFHRVHFQETWQVLFVVDCLDKMDSFYIYQKEKAGLQQAKGYFIYYEKNEEMQEYMLDHHVGKRKEEGAKRPKPEEAKSDGERKRRRPTPEERIDAAQEIRRVLQKRAKAAEAAQKSRYTMLAAVSCVLCVACVFMGFGFMKGLERLQSVEMRLAAVQTSYTALAEDVEGVKNQAVFSAMATVTEPEENEETETSEEEEVRTHIVEEGETLGYISRKYYGDDSGVDRIMEANGLEDANKIICGQELRIP